MSSSKKIIIGIVALGVLACAGFAFKYFSPSSRKVRHYQTGNIYFQKQKFAEAIQEFEDALEIDPAEEEVRYRLALAYQGNQNIERAIEELAYLVKHAPRYKPAYLPLMQIYTAQEKYQKALQVCDAFLEQYPQDLGGINQRGIILLQLGQEAKAEEEFKRAIALDNYDNRAFISLAVLHWNNQKREQALQVLKEFLQNQPNNFAARLQLGRFRLAQDKPDEATQAIRPLYKKHLFTSSPKFSQQLAQEKLPAEIRKQFQDNHSAIFYLSLRHEEDLKQQGTVSEDLRLAMQANQVNLLRNAQIKTVEAGQSWEIIDRNNTYLVKRKQHAFAVFYPVALSGNITLKAVSEPREEVSPGEKLLKSWKLQDQKTDRVFVIDKGTYFPLALTFADPLSQKSLSADFKKSLQENGVKLSDASKVEVQQENSIWKIRDPQTKEEYVIQRAPNTLVVYNPNMLNVYEKFPNFINGVAPTLALAELLAGDIREAVDVANEALEGKSKVNRDPRLVYVQGVGNLIVRNYEEASEQLDYAKRAGLSFPDLYYRLGLAYAAQQKNLLAIAELRDVLKNVPDYIEARTLLTELLMRERQLDRAEENCNKILESLPESADKDVRIRYLRLKARILAEKGENERARKVFDEISELDPSSVGGQLGKVLVDMSEQKYDQAIAALKQLRREERKRIQEENKTRAANEKLEPDPYLVYLLARNYLAKGDLEKALGHTKETLEMAENSIQASILLAEIRLMQRSPELAAEEYEKIYQAVPDNPRVALALSNLYLSTGEHDKAWDTLKKGGFVESQEAPFLEAKARIRLAQKEYRQALGYLEEIPESQKNPAILALMGDIHRQIGQQGTAREYYQRIEELAPGSPINVSIAISHYLERNWREASAALEQHISENPDDAVSRIFWSVVLLTSGFQQKALEEINVLFDNEKAEGIYWLGRLVKTAIYIYRDDFTAAREQVSEIPENLDALQKSIDGLITMCEEENSNITPILGVLLLTQMGQNNAALLQCQEAQRTLGDHPFLKYLEADLSLRVGKADQAEEILRKLAEDKNAPIFVNSTLGNLLMRKQEYKEAEVYLKRTLEQRAELPNVRIALALAYQGQDKIKDAVEEYKKVIDTTEGEKNPLRIQAYNNLAWLLLTKPTSSNLKAAIRFAKEAHKIYPNQPDIVDTLGWAYYKAKDLNNARRYLEHAYNLSPNQPSIGYHLAKVYAQMQEWKKAETILEKVLKLSQNFSEANEAQQLLEYVKRK